MNILSPDFGLLFWMLVTFAIVFGILAKFGFPVITRMVDKRRDYIQKSLDAADEANARLDGIRREAAEILDEAQRRQSEIIKAAVVESEKIVTNAQTKAAQEAEKQLEAARIRIEAQREKALSDINAQVAMLSLDVAEKILREKLGDREKQEELIVKMLDEAEATKRKLSHKNLQ